ncbi:hypothetical protein RclHR1_03860007 [Rhizophagus clarus]|uniref:Uncharacterized protein n=1 Tax=Rhizophagus clarus TaxID=94130 RepID=A0A2Z6RVA9_9GLOM|nr:hypothetical protein RclHR1_03860007 [Rhizophagus clarus]
MLSRERKLTLFNLQLDNLRKKISELTNLVNYLRVKSCPSTMKSKKKHRKYGWYQVVEPPPYSTKKKPPGKRWYHATKVVLTVMVLQDTTDGLRHHQTGNRLFLF